ncbi:hypothetical protein AAG906_024096 [Vitis piasezkii]|uniref:Uncharacterized protein n=1 Tax=Vitis vinifera TaxID=29760 RepID=A0A438KK31_VITVI|nr:hypothetical protein CK203_002082 [Vitis vinifera]
MSLRMVRSLGTGRFIEWGAVNGKGASGGIVVSWNSRVLELVGMEVEERSGGNQRLTAAMRRFSDIIDELQLRDLHLLRGPFTWRGGGAKALLLSDNAFASRSEHSCSGGTFKK